ncbi:F-type H+-transporting ATPase subunit gamma [Leeuwenhoekiella aestuarii]|uniref:F-type H+-transporting ATPase subunit gamma n=1 Tax=Leeuwenhoekiella aestuarii TaxID=2249426 RepID=A0A4Q0NUT2_9FLAO|nr:F0F1 ATP synthase subunit gamma [Leeuwenhoekiella aestuarii]RXG11647.1 F-type H+-transporting ATPase subunit gamma [Leeuwenhoekiella aestuarii]RXG15142.1 F-type H+-transporting ATPase subunit gamma [Leeuwenhoekiella aestuarii]
MDTLENLRGKIEGAKDLKSVVNAMKAMAGSNIIQYETAVSSLAAYYYTIALGIVGYFKAEQIAAIEKPKGFKNKEEVICAIVFGSDQGLVGQFNDSMANFVSEYFKALTGKKEVWVVGERMQLLLSDEGFNTSKIYPVPNAINGVTPLITEILNQSRKSQDNENISVFYIFHNKPKPDSGYIPVMQRFLPLDQQWKDDLQETEWPTKLLPQLAGAVRPTLATLIKGYLFTSLFKACVESLASENASRLEAMQRAEKNISDQLEDLNKKYHRLRQSSIDEELFDVVSGSEALKKS